MQLSEVIIPLLCGISPFAFGWILLSLFIGIRTGWEAGIRLFLLGLGLLVALSTIGAALYYLPVWAAVGLLLIGALSPWISLSRYFIASKFSGKLLLALPSKSEKWLTSIMSCAFSVLLGLQSIILHNNKFLTPEKSYALGFCLISLGVFQVLQKVRILKLEKRGLCTSLVVFINGKILKVTSGSLVKINFH